MQLNTCKITKYTLYRKDSLVVAGSWNVGDIINNESSSKRKGIQKELRRDSR
ncbi:hypothetical protein ACWKTL_29205 [Bacillus toyonensis]|uniref:hypothetical protein n=1 Tax=Bacillus tropicus TaxID=2026188 RepID=UPI0013D02329|nr:hypothetical protein [Bacillus tropicus]